MNQKIQLVIFDLDGTLVDAYQAVAESINYTLGQIGYDAVDDDTIKRTVGWGDRHLISAFVEAQDVDRALSIYRQHHARALKSATSFLPGAKELLRRLKAKGYKLAVASNRPTRFTHIILKHLGITESFDCVLCGDKITNPKPAADILKLILEKLSFNPDEALYVGDMTIDVETGKAAGVRTVAVTTGSSLREELDRLNPYRIIGQVLDVERIIESEKF